MAAPPLIGLLRQRPENPPPPRRPEFSTNRRAGCADARPHFPRSAAWWVIGLLVFGCAGDGQRESARSIFGASAGAEGEAPALVKVRAELGLVDDASLTAQVARIGRSVARPASVRSVVPSFHVVDQADANVFSVSDEFVFVTRGLLALVANEAELANLIAHELAHSEIGDLPVAASGLAALGIGSAVMQAAVGRRPRVRFAAGASLVGHFAVDSESDADALGQQNAAAAGFDAAALVDAFRGLHGVRRARAASMPDFFDRHPSSPERAARAMARANALAKSHATAGAGTRPMGWLEGLLVGLNPADGVFVGDRFVHHDLGYSLRLPRGWRPLHSRRAVGAVSPDGHAQVVLERQGPSGPPDEAGRIFLAELAGRMRIRVESRAGLRSAGLPAYRAIAFADTPAGWVRLELHWFTLATGVFRLVAASPPEGAETAEVAMRNVARSLQPLGDRERAKIREERLRFVTSTAGETLEQLSRRSRNAWSSELTAAINRLGPDQVLEAGTRIKVAVLAPFRGRDLGANPVRR
ncbi:MAG: M48 family metalloprotease [Deltaproteobacteria bacterium]|nr:M48 family metalloprotease [Deltaproteobacteria bacterium]MBW2402137.1 M48 family metalloprotease [Deltaproteobacteria bacterium]MBW2664792.1 M48 family metalloprotease [Deltaproteobacteria bacterium]